MSDKHLKERFTNGILWSCFERVGQQGSAFIVQLLLARLLAPAEFGLIAMVAVFVVVCSVLVESGSGFSRALIQKKDATSVDFSTVFFVNLTLAVVLSLALYALSPLIASFYGNEILTDILKFMTLGIILSSLGSVQQTILVRKLLFRKLFWISLPATIIAGTVGILMAFYGFGVWALVAQFLSMRFFTTLFLWISLPWRPLLKVDTQSLCAMFPYGARMALSGVLDQVFQNLYLLIIGKYFPASEVGYFQRARSFQQFPVRSIQSIFSRVFFPHLASIQDDSGKLRSSVRKGLQMSCFLIFPGMALLIGVSEPLVFTLVGEKWLPCVPYLKWLCLTGILFPLSAINLDLLAAVGRSDLFLKLDIIKKILIVVNIAITFRYGVQAMIFGMIAISAIGLILNTHFTGKFIEYGLFKQLYDVRNSAVAAVVIFGISTAASFENQLISLTVSFFMASVICLLSIRFLEPNLKQDIADVMKKFPGGGMINRILFYQNTQ